MLLHGLIDDFLAKGDRGGDADYIEVTPTDSDLGLVTNTPHVVLEIDSADYQQAASVLSSRQVIEAYGTLQSSQTFINASGGVDTIPVVQVLRLDKCGDNTFFCPAGTPTQTIFTTTAASF